MIGVHVHKGTHKTYDAAIIAASVKYNTNVVQIFVTNPRSYARIAMNLSNLALLVEDHNMRIYIHASYACQPWNVGLGRDRSLQALRKDIEACTEIDGRGVIMHLPARVGKLDETFARFPPNAPIALEMVSTLSPENYSNPAVLRPLPYKVCVDTAHLWSMGVKMRHRNTVQTWLDAMKDRIMLFHLNGSYELIGSGKDKHAVPFSKNDKIWGKVKYSGSSCELLVMYSHEYGIDMIVENNHDPPESVSTFLAMAGQ